MVEKVEKHLLQKKKESGLLPEEPVEKVWGWSFHGASLSGDVPRSGRRSVQVSAMLLEVFRESFITVMYRLAMRPPHLQTFLLTATIKIVTETDFFVFVFCLIFSLSYGSALSYLPSRPGT